MAEKKVIKIKQRRRKNRQYFFCYDIELADYLKREGFEVISKAKAISTDNVFWMFERDEELKEEIRFFHQQEQIA